MQRAERRLRIKEIEEDLEYQESKFWEDSPHHDMKISALRRELADLKKEDSEDSIFSFSKLKQFLHSLFGPKK